MILHPDGRIEGTPSEIAEYVLQNRPTRPTTKYVINDGPIVIPTIVPLDKEKSIPLDKAVYRGDPNSTIKATFPVDDWNAELKERYNNEFMYKLRKEMEEINAELAAKEVEDELKNESKISSLHRKEQLNK